MKIVTILAAAAIAGAPLVAQAGVGGLPPQGSAQAEAVALPVLGSIPAGAVVVGGVVIVAGVAIGVVAATEDDPTVTTTTTTN